MAANLVVLALILAMAGRCSSANYCLCKQGGDDALQKVLDYACGAGADCDPIKPNGACYSPNNVRAHCSYAVNSYYQKKSSSGGTCDFSGAAYLSSTDPSSSGCTYPASSSASGSSSTPSTSPTTPGTTPVTPVSGFTPTGTTTNSPYTTPGTGTGILGGVGTGLAPTGMGMNDDSRAGVQLRGSILTALLAAAFLSSVFL